MIFFFRGATEYFVTSEPLRYILLVFYFSNFHPMTVETTLGKYPITPVRYFNFTGGIAVDTRRVQPTCNRFWDHIETRGNLIPRGGGYSYVAASFSRKSVSIEHARFNRILSFDPARKMLEVESGITLGEIYQFLAPRGFYLSVQPGYPFITIGGCIAADVHGKNPFRDGNFRALVQSLILFHPIVGILKIDKKNDPDIFELTCGGYGLTGNIISASLTVTQLPSRFVRMRYRRLPNIQAFIPLFREAAKKADMIHTWHNFTTPGEAFGQGFIIEAKFVDSDEVGKSNFAIEQYRRRMKRPLTSENRGDWFFCFYNSLTASLLNRLYFKLNIVNTKDRFISLFDFSFPICSYKKYYFKLFGKKGQIEYQALLPFAAFSSYINVVKKYLKKNSLPITLGSAKLFSGQQSLLRFGCEGVSMSLDFPRNADGLKFAKFLDTVIPSFSGFPNIIKSIHLTKEVVAGTYPGYDEFCNKLHMFDPERKYRSELSERLEL